MAYQQGPPGQPPHYGPPGYGPPPGYGYPPPPPPPPGRSPLFWIFVVGLPLAVLFGCSAAVILIGTPTTPVTSSQPPAAHNSPTDGVLVDPYTEPPAQETAPAREPQQQPAQPSQPAQPVEQSTQPSQSAPAGAGAVLVSDEGSGTKNTAPFTADASWELRYSFDCADFGAKGNFIVTVYDAQNRPVALAVNTLGEKGEDKTPLYTAGTVHLEVTSTCKWKLTAVDVP